MNDHIRHDGDGTRAVQAPPDAAQEHASIVEALHDPFAFAVALLGACGARSPGKLDAPAPPVPKPERKPNQRKRRTAADVLKSRDVLARIGPLSGKTT